MTTFKKLPTSRLKVPTMASQKTRWLFAISTILANPLNKLSINIIHLKEKGG
jgi:hypothetical protein